jgi:hypothetical protein
VEHTAGRNKRVSSPVQAGIPSFSWGQKVQGHHRICSN